MTEEYQQPDHTELCASWQNIHGPATPCQCNPRR